MRIWDRIDPRVLCRKHLLGEHRELHGVWSILANGKKGYRNHPEVRRWADNLPALRARHEALTAEFERRGYDHHSPLPERAGEVVWPEPWDDQEQSLAAKGCYCELVAGNTHAGGSP